MSDTDLIEPPIETIAPEELRDGARRLLADRVDRRAGWGEGGGAADGSGLRDEMAELGWLLLTVPAAQGGLGQSFAALAPIYEEIGRALSPVTIADTMAAIDVLALAGDGAGDLIDRIVAGTARVAIVFGDLAADATNARFATIAGVAGASDLLVLPITGAGEPLLFALDGTAAMVAAVETWDRTRDFADVTLAGAAGVRLGVDGAAATAVARAHVDLALAWDCVGAAEQSLDDVVAYMGMRKQFGRPIGSFQALKHRAADHKVAIEIARALARQATETFAARGEGWSELTGQARLLAVDAFRAMAEDSVQLHGGIGFTWEHDCHLFLKRALMNEVLGETPEQVRDRVAPGILARALVRG